MPSLMPVPDTPWDLEEHADLETVVRSLAWDLPDLAAEGFTDDAAAPRSTLAQVSDCVMYLTAVKVTEHGQWDRAVPRAPRRVVGATSRAIVADAESWFREVMHEDVRIAPGAMILALAGWGYPLRRAGRGAVVVHNRNLTPRRPIPWWMRKPARVRPTCQGAGLRLEILIQTLIGRLQAGKRSDAQET